MSNIGYMADIPGSIVALLGSTTYTDTANATINAMFRMSMSTVKKIMSKLINTYTIVVVYYVLWFCFHYI